MMLQENPPVNPDIPRTEFDRIHSAHGEPVRDQEHRCFLYADGARMGDNGWAHWVDPPPPQSDRKAYFGRKRRYWEIALSRAKDRVADRKRTLLSLAKELSLTGHGRGVNPQDVADLQILIDHVNECQRMLAEIERASEAAKSPFERQAEQFLAEQKQKTAELADRIRSMK